MRLFDRKPFFSAHIYFLLPSFACIAMKKQSILFLMISILATGEYLGAQSLRFESERVEIGPVHDWSQDVARFVFTNTGSEKVAILRAEAPSDVQVSFPRRFIHPGEKDTILAWYLPVEPGPFQARFSLQTHLSEKPYALHFSGDVMSYDACPNPAVFASSEGPERQIILRDSLSGNPIAGASIQMVLNHRTQIKARSRNNGKVKMNLKPGLYQLLVTSEGYVPLQGEFYLNYSRRELVFSLLPEANTSLPMIVQTSDAFLNDSIAMQQAVVSPDTLEDFVLVWTAGGGNVDSPSAPPAEMADLSDDGALSLSVFAENNLVFLIDVSSSMRSQGKLDRLKEAMEHLVLRLRNVDRVSFITYARRTQTLLEALPAHPRDSLINLIRSLDGRGATYGASGLQDAYQMAEKHFIPGGNNQVILATDGEFNSPGFSDRKLELWMKTQRDKGIILSVIGFGQNVAAVKRMEMLSGLGGGKYLDFTPGTDPGILLLDEIKRNARRQ